MLNEHFVDQSGEYFVTLVPTETPEGWTPVSPRPAPHWLWVDGQWVEGTVPAAPVPNLSFAQLLIGLVSESWITEAEGEAWLAGTLPFNVLLVIDGLPADQRFPAKARALRPSEVLRLDPLVIGMGAAAGKTDVEIDAFFTTYSSV